MSARTVTTAGTLWVLATPIGNLEDISDRAKRVLGEVDRVAAEDTRVARRLLSALGISARLMALHDHNESQAAEAVIGLLKQGESIALISDAGTPLISDPGYRLLARVRAEGLVASPVPGACAAIAGLSVAGLPSDRFWFEGFLPARPAARRARLETLSSLPATLIFYETGRRLVAALNDMALSLGVDREAVVARELTKAFETVHSGQLPELARWTDEDPNRQRGEVVVLVAGCADPTPPIPVRTLARELASELPPARAAKVLARLTGLDRKAAWDLVETLKRQE